MPAGRRRSCGARAGSCDRRCAAPGRRARGGPCERPRPARRWERRRRDLLAASGDDEPLRRSVRDRCRAGRDDRGGERDGLARPARSRIRRAVARGGALQRTARCRRRAAGRRGESACARTGLRSVALRRRARRAAARGAQRALDRRQPARAVSGSVGRLRDAITSPRGLRTKRIRSTCSRRSGAPCSATAACRTRSRRSGRLRTVSSTDSTCRGNEPDRRRRMARIRMPGVVQRDLPDRSVVAACRVRVDYRRPAGLSAGPRLASAAATTRTPRRRTGSAAADPDRSTSSGGPSIVTQRVAATLPSGTNPVDLAVYTPEPGASLSGFAAAFGLAVLLRRARP